MMTAADRSAVWSATFHELWARLPDAPGHARQVAFDALPERAQHASWAALGADCRERTEAENQIRMGRPKRHQPAQRSTAAASTGPGTVALSSHDDPLKAVPPRVYFEAIAGFVVPSNGRVSCPVPGHEDRHPSCQVTNTNWRCWSCRAGGSIIDLAAAMYGIEPRGSGYWRLRDLILERLLWAPQPEVDR